MEIKIVLDMAMVSIPSRLYEAGPVSTLNVRFIHSDCAAFHCLTTDAATFAETLIEAWRPTSFYPRKWSLGAARGRILQKSQPDTLAVNTYTDRMSAIA